MRISDWSSDVCSSDLSAMLRREAEGQRHVEFLERGHLSVEPRFGIRAEAVGPAQPGAQMPHAELPQPLHRIVEPMVFEVKPLADAEIGRALGEAVESNLR